MVRKIVIALAAAGAVIAGSAFDASARMSGMSRGSMGGSMGSSMSRGSMGPSVGRMGPSVGSFPRAAVVPGKTLGVASGKVVGVSPGVLHSKVHVGKHRRVHNRFFVYAAAGYPYGYYDSCYERVWTRWGWRLVYVCGDYPY